MYYNNNNYYCVNICLYKTFIIIIINNVLNYILDHKLYLQK